MAFSRNEKIVPIRSSFELKNGARTIGRINIWSNGEGALKKVDLGRLSKGS